MNVMIYSKALGSLIGGALGWAVGQWGLPADWASPEVTNAITVIMSTLFTYFFPPNAK